MLDQDASLGDALERNSLLRQWLAEWAAFDRPSAHPLEDPLGKADQPHAVVDAAWPEAPLSDFEAAAFPKEHIRSGDTDVLEQHLGCPIRHSVVAEYRQRSQDTHAWGIHGHQHHRLLAVLI